MDAFVVRTEGAKRQKIGGASDVASSSGHREPEVYVTLNTDGVVARLVGSSNSEARPAAGRALLDHLANVAGAAPDVLLITEVHIPSAGSSRRGVPATDAVGSKAERERAERTAAAVAMLTAPESPFAKYAVYFSLHEAHANAGVCVLLHQSVSRPLSVRYSLDRANADGTHHPEGRVVQLSFASCTVLCVYAPNPGKTHESFLRRQEWTNQLHSTVQALRTADDAKPIILFGDLNVAPNSDFDLTNKHKFPDGAGHTGAYATSQIRGFPCTAPVDRLLFDGVNKAGGLVDAYRALHPGVKGGWTWCGVDQNPGRLSGFSYLGGESMRLDHFCISAELLPRVAECEALAYDKNSKAAEHKFYFGSDHCPLWLKLKPA